MTPARILAMLFGSLVSAALLTAAEPPVPALRFDASQPQSIERSGTGIKTWHAVTGRGELRTDEGAAAPIFVATERAVRFDGSAGPLRLATPVPLHLGSLHVFLVAQLSDPSIPSALFSTDTSARFNLIANTKEFMIALGEEPHSPKHGPRVDTALHVFELAHILPDDEPRAMRPGQFRVDGALVGTPWSRNRDSIAGHWSLGGGAEGPLHGQVQELLIFDHALTEKEAVNVRAALAAKWRVALKPAISPPPAGQVKEVRVGPAGVYTSFGIYDESPESPDGTRIAYIQFDPAPTQESPVAPFSIWICNRDLTHQRRLLVSPVGANSHNGAFLQWIDNDRLAFCGGHLEDLPNGKKAVRNIYVADAHTGKILRGPYTHGFLGDSTVGRHSLFCIDSDGSNVGPRGVYELNADTGEIRSVVTAAQVAHFAQGFSWPSFRTPDRWQPTHANFSPKGTRLSFEFMVGGSMYMLFTCRRDGSDLRYWGTDKPLHEHWFDEETLCGSDELTDDGKPDDLTFRRWDLTRRVVEDLAGLVTHTAMSPDRKWYAGETFYWSDPVRLYVYRRGERRPALTVFEAPAGTIWKGTAHVNPSFSRDGRRLYYCRPVGPDLKETYYVDLPGE